jgi:hypothetical protein
LNKKAAFKAAFFIRKHDAFMLRRAAKTKGGVSPPA